MELSKVSSDSHQLQQLFPLVTIPADKKNTRLKHPSVEHLNIGGLSANSDLWSKSEEI